MVKYRPASRGDPCRWWRLHRRRTGAPRVGSRDLSGACLRPRGALARIRRGKQAVSRAHHRLLSRGGCDSRNRSRRELATPPERCIAPPLLGGVISVARQQILGECLVDVLAIELCYRTIAAAKRGGQPGHLAPPFKPFRDAFRRQR